MLIQVLSKFKALAPLFGNPLPSPGKWIFHCKEAYAALPSEGSLSAHPLHPRRHREPRGTLETSHTLFPGSLTGGRLPRTAAGFDTL